MPGKAEERPVPRGLLRRLPFPEEDVPALDELYPKIIDFDDEEYTGDKQPAE
jgi:hypothetical protein